MFFNRVFVVQEKKPKPFGALFNTFQRVYIFSILFLALDTPIFFTELDLLQNLLPSHWGPLLVLQNPLVF